MSALAKILIERGLEISGSDAKDSPTLDMLKSLGARIFVGHKAKNILDAAGNPVDAVVCSSAIPADNPEVIAAGKFKIPKLHRSDINAWLLNSRKGIAVSGSHGKTTTTSMIGYVLHSANVDPTIIIGGESTDLGTGAILGKSDWLVTEADESDGSFVTLKPKISVVTNIEDDHLDHYGTVEKLCAAFKIFIENTDRAEGVAVLCFDNENLRALAKEIDRKIISYAIDHDADFKAKNIRTTGKGITFEVQRGEETLGKINLAIHGRHNVLNALATVATALEVGVSFDKIAEGLSHFHGAKRRFQTKGRVRNIFVVDDYAHHPTEIAATLKA
ncbi:MAG: UDP-N-acetylmuramate--L-alanine ligase, partial [Selenomonadaceae bacterium]|nr:UDP-N-acetylmuramate--L-alanine ligase [Selenomonadaceae bacterium]